MCLRTLPKVLAQDVAGVIAAVEHLIAEGRELGQLCCRFYLVSEESFF